MKQVRRVVYTLSAHSSGSSHAHISSHTVCEKRRVDVLVH